MDPRKEFGERIRRRYSGIIFRESGRVQAAVTDCTTLHIAYVDMNNYIFVLSDFILRNKSILCCYCVITELH